jgi:hypothetical protein
VVVVGVIEWAIDLADEEAENVWRKAVFAPAGWEVAEAA